MKELMLGNKALARGLYEAGCCVASSYPGTPSTEVTEEIAKYRDIYSEWAPNEKVALETAFGAALAGKRAMSAMKHVGLNVAADPLYTASYTGVNAGLVVVVADDAGMHSSQNEQDSRRHAIAAKLPMLEPSDSGEALAFAKAAYELSEAYDTPVLIKMCTRIAHSQSVVETGTRTEQPVRPYRKDPVKYLMTPANAIKKHPVVEARTRKLVELGNGCTFHGVELNRVELGGKKRGIICDSTCYQYAKEVFGDTASILKLGLVNPLPTTLITDFAAQVEELWVFEELDPVIETHCRALGLAVYGKLAQPQEDGNGCSEGARKSGCPGVLPLEGEYSQNLLRERLGLPVPEAADSLEVPIPPRPPVMCAGCPHRGLFYTLHRLKVNVMGDIGCYTLGGAAPLSAMDMNLCMGASVSALHGFNKALGAEAEGKTVAVIGDSTFLHSGMTSLADIAYNLSNSTVIILDNSITGMTGHQQNPSTGLDIHGDPCGKIDLESLVRAMGIDRVRVIDPYDLKECDTVLREELAAKAPSVIIARRPCALLKTVDRKSVVHKKPLVCDRDACVGCRSCMRIGCPAISMKDGKAQIDRTQCIGCGVCTQLCRVGALQAQEGE